MVQRGTISFRCWISIHLYIDKRITMLCVVLLDILLLCNKKRTIPDTTSRKVFKREGISLLYMVAKCADQCHVPIRYDTELQSVKYRQELGLRRRSERYTRLLHLH